MYDIDQQHLRWHDEIRKRYAAISAGGSVSPTAQLDRLWKSAIERSGDPLLSLHIGQIFRPMLSLFTAALMWSPTVRESLQQLARFWNPHGEAGRFSFMLLEDRGATAELQYRMTDGLPGNRHDVEFRLCHIVTVLRNIADPALAPERVRFQHDAPAYRAELEKHFRLPVLFGESVNALEFGPPALDRPVLATAGQRGQIVRLVEQELSGTAREGNLPDLLRETIRGHLQEGQFAMKVIAPKLGMSPRTLQRRLQLRGTSFQELLDEARKEECLKSLQTSKGPYSQIAERLGYSNVANFHRAFRRWFGQTPNQMRRRLMESSRGARLKVADSDGAEILEPG